MTVEQAILRHIPRVKGRQSVVYKAMQEALLAGGKRVRPRLMWEAYKLFAGGEADMDNISSYMAAIEMIHTSSLIHDDLPCMDNDRLRRGKPTTWVSFGEDMAVLAGDALIVEACSLIASHLVNTSDIFASARAMGVLAQKTGMQGMIGGQVVDVEKTGEELDESELEFVYRLKTGALLEASMMVGAILGGADDEEVDIVEEAASCLGLAFQIQDDVLDDTSTEEELGKPIHSDQRNKKSTYVSLYGLEAAKEKVRELSEKAKRLLEKLPSDKTALYELVDSLINRRN